MDISIIKIDTVSWLLCLCCKINCDQNYYQFYLQIYKAIDIPSNSSVTGKCGKTEQNLTLSWVSQNKIAQNNFTIHFVKNETGKYYSLHHFEISLAAEEFPNDKSSIYLSWIKVALWSWFFSLRQKFIFYFSSDKTVTFVHVAPQFKTGLTNSYRCIKEQKLDLILEGKNVTVGLLKVTDLQFQAFRGDNSTIFGLGEYPAFFIACNMIHWYYAYKTHCPFYLLFFLAKDCSFDTPDIVPITVGCALAA